MRSLAVRLRPRSWFRIGAPLLLIGLLSGCLLPPEPKSEAAQDVYTLYVAILALAALVFFGVEGFIVYAIIRYRRKPGDDALPPQHHGNNLVEIIWTAIPSVIVVVLFVLSMITLGTVNARADRPGVEIQVEGFQWQWTFRYPEGVTVSGTGTEPPELWVPVGEPVRLTLDSPDVIHSFYVPQFLIKRDVVPVGANGEANELEFTVSEPGTYSGQCAEFCGTAHADMTFTVRGVPRAEYDTWFAAALAGETPQPTAGDCPTTIEVSAADLAFNTDHIDVPAGEPFCIAFTNEDTLPHDIGIYDGGSEHFNGDDVPAGESVTYQVDALEAGDYEFICNLHPADMTGTLTAQ